jgi:hypothetical protein
MIPQARTLLPSPDGQGVYYERVADKATSQVFPTFEAALTASLSDKLEWSAKTEIQSHIDRLNAELRTKRIGSKAREDREIAKDRWTRLLRATK